MAMNNAGGHFVFGPTFNSTDYVRAAIEGPINGFYDVDATVAEAVEGKTAGRFAAISADGKVVFAGAKGAGDRRTPGAGGWRWPRRNGNGPGVSAATHDRRLGDARDQRSGADQGATPDEDRAGYLYSGDDWSRG